MCQQFLISLISILMSIFLLWVLFLYLGRGNSVPDNVPSPQQRSGALRDMHGGASEREAKQRHPNPITTITTIIITITMIILRHIHKSII